MLIRITLDLLYLKMNIIGLTIRTHYSTFERCLHHYQSKRDKESFTIVKHTLLTCINLPYERQF